MILTYRSRMRTVVKWVPDRHGTCACDGSSDHGSPVLGGEERAHTEVPEVSAPRPRSRGDQLSEALQASDVA